MSMHPGESRLDRATASLCRQYPDGGIREFGLHVIDFVRRTDPSVTRMMGLWRLSEGVPEPGEQGAPSLEQRFAALTFLTTAPAAILEATAFVREDGRRIRVPAETVALVLDGKPAPHPLTGVNMEYAGDRIVLAYDLRPDVLAERFREFHVAGRGESGKAIVVVTATDAASTELAGADGVALVAGRDPDQAAVDLRDAAGAGALIFAAIDALPDRLHLPTDTPLVLHPDLTEEGPRCERAMQLVAQAESSQPGLV